MAKSLMLLLAGWFLACAATAQVPGRSTAGIFEDVAPNHWAYRELSRLRAAGFPVVPVTDEISLHSRSSATRYEIGVRVYLILKARTMPEMQNSMPALTPQAKASLWRLVREFRPELRTVEENDAKLIALLRPLGPEPIAAPFRDVPPTHWAYPAVESLRKQGILLGYPNGTFDKSGR